MNVDQPLGFAVVGLGMGKHHCRSVTRAAGAQLVTVCDVRRDLAEQVAEQYGCKAYTSVEEMLLDPAVQVVNVAVPTGLHAEVGIAAARAGKHVICEKPLDINLEKADALIRACHENGVKLAGIFQRRLEPLSKRVKQVVEAGRLGKIIYADIHLYWWRAESYYTGGWPAGWHGTWALDGGGAIMNQGIHSVDFIQWITGPIKSVFAKTGTFTHAIECEDVGVAVVTFANGALGNIMCTTSAYPGLTNDFHLLGERGSIVLRNDSEVITWRIQGEREEAEEQEMRALYPGSRTSASADPMAVGFDGHTVEIEDMVECIRHNRTPLIPGEEARHAIGVILAIQESARTGKEVDVRR